MRPGESDPRDISKHCAGCVELAPEVQQHQVVAADRAVDGRRRQIVRVARVFSRRHDGIRIADESLVAKPSRHELLNVVFRGGDAVDQPSADRFERSILHAVELFRRRAVCRDGRIVPYGREALDQVA